MDEDKAFKSYDEKSENLLKDLLVSEPPMGYVSSIERPYVDPFIDWAFKRIFASGPSKDVAKAFINEVLKGKREVQTITYGKNEYPGEIKEEGGAVLDFI